MHLNGPMEWFVLSFIVVFTVLAPLGVRMLWRGRREAEANLIAGYWYKSEGLRRGHVRAILVQMLALLVLNGLAAVFLVDLQSAVTDWAILVCMMAELVLVVLYWSIVLFNRPKFLVAPHLRDDVGAIAARRLRKAGRGLAER
jgi:hypothetical protein